MMPLHLGFIHGAALPDPDGLLRRTGKAKRYVEFAHAKTSVEGRLRSSSRAEHRTMRKMLFC